MAMLKDSTWLDFKFDGMNRRVVSNGKSCMLGAISGMGGQWNHRVLKILGPSEAAYKEIDVWLGLDIKTHSRRIKTSWKREHWCQVVVWLCCIICICRFVSCLITQQKHNLVWAFWFWFLIPCLLENNHVSYLLKYP